MIGFNGAFAIAGARSAYNTGHPVPFPFWDLYIVLKLRPFSKSAVISGRNVSLRTHFELLDNFGLILCDVHKRSCCALF